MPARDLEIRRATRDDLPAIVALLADDDIGGQRESAGALLPEYERAFEAILGNDDELLGFRATHEGMKLRLDSR